MAFGVHRFVIYHWEEGEIPREVVPVVERWIAGTAPLTDTERAVCAAAAKATAAAFLSIAPCLLLVRKIASSAIRQPEDAEEVIEDVMLKLTRSGWDHPFPEKLVRHVTRKALSSFRRRRSKEARFSSDVLAVLDELADARAGEPSMTASLQISRYWYLVQRWVDGLVLGQRQVVEPLFEGCSAAEIGRELDLSESVVHQRIYRARRHLREDEVFAPLREAFGDRGAVARFTASATPVKRSGLRGAPLTPWPQERITPGCPILLSSFARRAPVLSGRPSAGARAATPASATEKGGPSPPR